MAWQGQQNCANLPCSSMDKISGAKDCFRHESEMGHAIGPPRLQFMCYDKICAKKRCGLWLTFLLHDLAIFDLRTLRKPLFHLKNLCTKTPSTNNRLTAGWIFKDILVEKRQRNFWALYWQDPLLLNISVANV